MVLFNLRTVFAPSLSEWTLNRTPRCETYFYGESDFSSAWSTVPLSTFYFNSSIGFIIHELELLIDRFWKRKRSTRKSNDFSKPHKKCSDVEMKFYTSVLLRDCLPSEASIDRTGAMNRHIYTLTRDVECGRRRVEIKILKTRARALVSVRPYDCVQLLVCQAIYFRLSLSTRRSIVRPQIDYFLHFHRFVIVTLDVIPAKHTTSGAICVCVRMNIYVWRTKCTRQRECVREEGTPWLLRFLRFVLQLLRHSRMSDSAIRHSYRSLADAKSIVSESGSGRRTKWTRFTCVIVMSGFGITIKRLRSNGGIRVSHHSPYAQCATSSAIIWAIKFNERREIIIIDWPLLIVLLRAAVYTVHRIRVANKILWSESHVCALTTPFAHFFTSHFHESSGNKAKKWLATSNCLARKIQSPFRITLMSAVVRLSRLAYIK